MKKSVAIVVLSTAASIGVSEMLLKSAEAKSAPKTESAGPAPAPALAASAPTAPKPVQVSVKQARILREAYRIARADGHRNPEIVQQVVLQESHAGGLKVYRVANAGPNAYYGVSQIKLIAARDVLKKHPSLYDSFALQTRTDDEVKAHLILNEQFNLSVASKYLLLLQQRYGYTGRDLLNAYNRGPTGVKSVDSARFHYAIQAEKKLTTWKKGQKA